MFNNIYTDIEKASILRVKGYTVVEKLRKSIYDFSSFIDMHAYNSADRIIDLVGDDKDKYLMELRDYQTVGVAFLYYAYRSILGDDMGLGKTVIACSLINTLREYGKLTKFIFVGDNNSVTQVVTEFRKMTGLNVVSLKGDAKGFKRALKEYDMEDGIEHIDGIVLPHSALATSSISNFLSDYIDEDGKSMFNTFILDESSVVKNHKTARFKWLQDYLHRVERVHFLNATAVENSIVDIYNQLVLLDKKALPSRSRLENDFCVKHTKAIYVGGRRKYVHDIKGYKDTQLFREKIALYYLGRSSNVLGVKKEHKYEVILVDKTITQEVLLKQKVAIANTILNNPVDLECKGLSFTRKDVPKLGKLIDLIDTRYRGKKVFIYCFNKEAQKRICDEISNLGISVALLNGDVVDDERQYVIDGFNGTEYDVLVSNIQRAVNLPKGEVCIYYQNILNPARMDQIKGRIDRNESLSEVKNKEYILMLYNNSNELRDFKELGLLRSKGSVELTKDFDTIILQFYKALDLQEG